MPKSWQTALQFSLTCPKFWATLLSALIISSCAPAVQLTPEEQSTAKLMRYDPAAVLVLKRVVGSHVVIYRERHATQEQVKLKQALKQGQTDGERGELLIQSLDDNSRAPITGLQAALPAGTSSDTMRETIAAVIRQLPPGYTATFNQTDGVVSIVLKKD